MPRLFCSARMLLACVAVAVLAAVPANGAAAQAPEVYVTGRVVDATSGEPVVGAELTIEGANLRAVSNEDGTYRLGPVPPGPQVLEVRSLGYAAARIPLEVPAEGTLERDVRLDVSALRMEGVTVTADLAGRARGELGTATVAGREAILAQSAASLAGVLELIPGTPLSAPGLDQVQQATLRAVPTSSGAGGAWSAGVSASQLAAFGTLIVVDGVPLSNNANLQSGGLGFPSTVGGGIDLRRIPSSTIERVEVIRGIPSARFGDLTQGAIVVETRAGALPATLAGRLDRRTGGSSLTGGWDIGDAHALSVSADFARTRIDPGVTPDESHRYTLQLAHRGSWGSAEGGGDRLVADTRADLFRTVEEQPENPDLFPGRERWMRDAGLRFSHRLRLARPGGSLNLLVALDMNRQESYSQRLLTRTAMPVTDRMEEGRAEGEYLEGEFLAQSEVEGAPRFLFGQLAREIEGRWLGLRHTFRAGLGIRREWNVGTGLDFDPRFPPQLSFTGVRGHDRPRRLDLIAPLTVTSGYLDDRLTRSLPIGTLNLQAGVRADVLHEEGEITGGVRDVALQPRLNAEIAPRPWLRIRGGWGIAAKSPSILQLSPAPEYYDLVNLNWFTDAPEERRAIMTTSVRDGTNPELGFSRAEIAEGGVEIGFSGGEGILSFTGFHETVRDGVGMRSLPGFLPREHFQLADSTVGNGVPPEIIEPAHRVDTVPVLVSQPANHVTLASHGIEAVASFPEIEALRTRVQLQGAWTWSSLEDEDYDYGSIGRFDDFQHRHVRDRIPIWESPERTGERGIVTYRVTHHQPAVGLIITANVQHDLYESDHSDASGDPLEWVGYLTRAGERVLVPRDERDRPEYQDLRDTSRGVPPRAQSAPADWLLSIQATKTLTGDGRVTFWAFNVLDNLGYFSDGDTRGRSYDGLRFGLEVNLPVGVMEEW